MKILICSHWMEIGGAERALLGLLYSLDYSILDVDLYLCRHTGEFLDLIPDDVNILPEDPKAASIAKPIKEVLRDGYFFIALGRIVGKICTSLYTIIHKSKINSIAIEYSNRFTYPFVRRINPNTEYDLLISFLEPHYIAAHKANAKKKIAWMHTDYGYIDVDIKAGYKIWGLYDAIAAISVNCKNNFLEKFPKLRKKVFILENINHPELIRNQAEKLDVTDEMDGCINILSVGRFAVAKNFDNIPEICALIRDTGLDVKWFLIGYGGEEVYIRRKIKEYGMEKYVVILGKKDNPYPYIAKCDLYVQPSRYEGKSVTVREAQILGKPVVITKYPTSASQLEDGFDGVIVPLDNNECAKEIVALLKNPTRMKELSENCAQTDYSNTEQLQNLFEI